MSKPPVKLFELGRYWLGHVAGSDRIYRFWYDAGAGEIRRRSTKTADLAAAKIQLAALVLKEGSGKAEDPANVPLIACFTRYQEGHSNQKRAKNNVKLACAKVLDHFGNDAKVSALNKAGQIKFLKARRAKGDAISTICSQQSLIQAALNYCVHDDEAGNAGLLTRAPKIIYSKAKVAEILNEAEPVSRNWHPTLDQIAAFMNATTEDEEPLRRFLIIKLAFATRSEAACEVGPFCLDRDYRLISINPPGRRQTKKHRPTLPVPDPLWPLLNGQWATTSTFVIKRKASRPRRPGKPVQMNAEWRAVVERAGLPPEMIPNSIRHFMATALRHAHLRYGCARVPADEREMWLGHRRLSVHDSYGAFEPDFLGTAKAAVEAILLALDEKLDKPLFRQFSAKTGGALSVVK